MPVLLILLVATVVEVTVLVAVGNAIGVLATLGLLILASLVGAALLRREGTRTLVAFREALSTRRPPHRELIDGMLIATAGVLIVLPGFVSDVLGLLLLLPPTRALVRRRMLRSAVLHTPVRFAPSSPVRFARAPLWTAMVSWRARSSTSRRRLALHELRPDDELR